MPLFDTFPFVRQDVPLAMYSRLQIGGKAEYFAEPDSEEQLVALIQHVSKEQMPVRVLGAGSNILVPDDGVAGLVVLLSRPSFCAISSTGNQITAGGGAKLTQVITQAVVQGSGGIENLIGIPGTFGGALCCNVGTTSGDLGQWVESVRLLDFAGSVTEISKRDLAFSHSENSFDNGIILSATLSLDEENRNELAKRMQKLWIIRKTQQPSGEMPSVFAFKNTPSGTPAADLIDQAGLKGTAIGGASISERNAGFIVVGGDCIANDVIRLIRLVQDEVTELTEIQPESALCIW